MLLVLIACQSVWLMADTHPFDQVSTGHTESNHTHGFADKAHPDVTGNSSQDSNPDLDGHHCHSSAHLFISFFTYFIGDWIYMLLNFCLFFVIMVLPCYYFRFSYQFTICFVFIFLHSCIYSSSYHLIISSSFCFSLFFFFFKSSC